jgi:prevent-host-death family protein
MCVDDRRSDVLQFDIRNDYGNMTRVVISDRRGGTPMKRIISKSQFKPRALKYFREVEQTGRELIIADRGRPVLKIVPYAEDPEAWLKPLRGSVVRYKAPTEPVAVDDWGALQ